MWILLTSISCSVAVSVLLKVARARNIQIAQAVVVNYVVATILCLWILRPNVSTLATPSMQWLILLALGVLLPSVFLIMARAVVLAGIVRSDAAQRLSLIIPLAAAFLWFGESASTNKWIGLSFALLALLLLLHRPNKIQSSQQATYATAFALLGVWLGYGVIDILFKELARSGAVFSSSLLASFILAGVLLGGVLLFKGHRFDRSSILGGLLLGSLNFGNIYFYIRAHQAYPDNPTLVFSAMNVGVISLGTLVGALVFRERLSLWNGLGIGLAIVAIFLLFPRPGLV